MMEIKVVEFDEMNSIIDNILGADQEEKVGPFVEEKRKISFALIADGKIVGGVTAKMNFNRCHVSGLGIEKEFRRGGSGALLMNKVEDAAIEVGAKIITVSTQDFQAREFYERLGYEVFGELEDCPFEGTTKYYMSKRVG